MFRITLTIAIAAVVILGMVLAAIVLTTPAHVTTWVYPTVTITDTQLPTL